jgi:hypothetical protein
MALLDYLKKLKKGTTFNKLINNSPNTPYGEKELYVKNDNIVRDFPRQLNVKMGNTLRTKKQMNYSKKRSY